MHSFDFLSQDLINAGSMVVSDAFSQRVFSFVLENIYYRFQDIYYGAYHVPFTFISLPDTITSFQSVSANISLQFLLHQVNNNFYIHIWLYFFIIFDILVFG